MIQMKYYPAEAVQQTCPRKKVSPSPPGQLREATARFCLSWSPCHRQSAWTDTCFGWALMQMSTTTSYPLINRPQGCGDREGLLDAVWEVADDGVGPDDWFGHTQHIDVVEEETMVPKGWQGNQELERLGGGGQKEHRFMICMVEL